MNSLSAEPIIRMEPDVQNHGFTIGLIAATASRENKKLREIDITKIQKQLVEKNILPFHILNETDDFKITKMELQLAVDDVLGKPVETARLFVDVNQSLPLVKKAYLEAIDKNKKILYARILGIMGDDTGIDTLISQIRGYYKWDEGVHWKLDLHLIHETRTSVLDGLIIAAGYSGNEKTIDAIVEKVKMLTDEDEFSHHRAVSIALERLGTDNEKAIEALSDLLNKPGISGHAMTSINKAVDEQNARRVSDILKNSLREIVLARALYRCGDDDGKAKRILELYSNDVRGHFARHARGILESKQGLEI